MIQMARGLHHHYNTAFIWLCLPNSHSASLLLSVAVTAEIFYVEDGIFVNGLMAYPFPFTIWENFSPMVLFHQQNETTFCSKFNIIFLI